MSKITILVVLCLALCLITGVANPQQTASGVQPPPAVFFNLGLTGISADQQYLYVMAGGKILQYEISEMTLLRSVDLPDIAPPQGAPPEPADHRKVSTASPMGGPPQGLWAGNGFLYVLAGPAVCIYSVPDLTLQKTVQLPKPELPQAGN